MKALVAVDDSKFSDAGLAALITQFRSQGAEVRVLHVVEPISISVPPQMSADYAPELEEQVRTAHELVERAANRLRSAGFKVDTAVDKGDSRERIIDSAAAWGADLIVLGSHGRRGVERVLLGSVAEFVARHARCSVEIVRIPV